MMCAARFGSKQVMRMVLEHLRNLEMDGYFLRQRNRLGLSALEMARMENPDCAKVITKHLVAYGHNTGAGKPLTFSPNEVAQSHFSLAQSSSRREKIFFSLL